MSGQLQPVDEVRGALEKMQPQFAAALPPQVDAKRFLRITMTAIQQNPDLLGAERRSLYGACMRSAQDGLLPDGREAALVIFSGKVQYMPMVEGLIKKVRNSGEIANISVQIVKEGDYFDYELGDSEKIVHKPALSSRGKTIGAYSIVTMKNGEKSREWMSVDEVEAVRKRSRSADKGPWKTDYDEMCRKTVFRRHYKRLPKSTDLDGAIKADDETFDMDAAERDVTPPPKERPAALQAVLDQAPPPTAHVDTTTGEVMPAAQEVDNSPI